METKRAEVRVERVQIENAADVAEARRLASELSRDGGFDAIDQVLVATAVSEVARNILHHGAKGHVSVSCVPEGPLKIEARDYGDGMTAAQVARANQGAAKPGSGLAIAHKAVDELQVVSGGSGTVVTMIKHRSANGSAGAAARATTGPRPTSGVL